MSFYPSIRPSIRPSIHPSIYPSLYLYLSIFMKSRCHSNAFLSYNRFLNLFLIYLSSVTLRFYKYNLCLLLLCASGGVGAGARAGGVDDDARRRLHPLVKQVRARVKQARAGWSNVPWSNGCAGAGQTGARGLVKWVRADRAPVEGLGPGVGAGATVLTMV